MGRQDRVVPMLGGVIVGDRRDRGQENMCNANSEVRISVTRGEGRKSVAPLFRKRSGVRGRKVCA